MRERAIERRPPLIKIIVLITMVKVHKLMALSSLPALFLSLPQQASGLLLSTSVRNHSSLFCSLSSRRSAIANTAVPILQMMTSSASSSPPYSYSPTQKSVEQALSLLESVYGPANSPDFPRPMPSYEAGPCPCTWGTSPSNPREQHRYLWTDAFAVMAYQTLAEYYACEKYDEKEANVYQNAVDKLIHVVHECLGKPRSGRVEDEMTKCDVSPTGYVGLRIGKEESRKVTDYGMHYDGQYFHYVDKWLFALARANHVEEGIRIAKSCFPYFFSSSRYGGGIRWKLSVDATPPSSMPQVYGPNDDTLNALIVFSMLEAQNKSTQLSLKDEIASLQKALHNYHPRVTNDPLGWGLEALFDQFVKGNPRAVQLQNMAREALHPTHISLPFRLYGALIGALVVPSSAISDQVSPEYLQKVLELCIEHQFQEMEKESSSSSNRYREEHSSINRTMLAMALLSPGVLKRRMSDPLLNV